MEETREEEKSKKDPMLALFLSVFFGWCGLGRLYLERIEGILQVMTLGGFGIWWIYDIILIITGKMRDGDGKLLEPPDII